jgi:outer membrane protein OmpA-like peptidoglycan-associated protein
VLTAQSHDILDAVAATINNNPEIDSVEVQAHAGGDAHPDYLLQLTASQAKEVVRYLLSRKVSPEKLKPRGFGIECPIKSGPPTDTAETNQRVEFKVLSINGVQTEIKTYCKENRLDEKDRREFDE